jgi:hypothetical protein
MIAHARVSGCFGAAGPPVSGRRSRLHLMCAARAVSGVRLPQIYKSREREGRILYLST